MPYFKINYNKLEKLPQINIYKFILVILIIILLLLLISCFQDTYHTFSTYGIYKNNVLHLKINNKLSDAVKDSEYFTFNKEDTKCVNILYDEYEIIDNEIYQSLSITVDKEYADNEVGLVTFYYRKQKLITFIMELFK